MFIAPLYKYVPTISTLHCGKILFDVASRQTSHIKDRKSRSRYQNNLPAAHRVF